MADQVVQVQPDSTGKKIDTSELTVGANTVERQRIVIASDSGATSLADVLNTAPSATAIGLVTRPVPSTVSSSAALTSASPVDTAVEIVATDKCTGIVHVFGTYGTAEIFFEGSLNGTDYFPLNVSFLDGPAQTTTFADIGPNQVSTYLAPIAGLKKFRVRAAIVPTSGTLNIVVNGSSLTGAPQNFGIGLLQVDLVSISGGGLARGQGLLANSIPVVLPSNGNGATAATALFNKITDGTNTMPVGDIAGRAIFHRITDGTNSATVKAASTLSLPTDTALVVTVRDEITVALNDDGVGIAKDATLTGGTQKSIVRGGAFGTTTAADVTSTSSGANHRILDVGIYDGSGNLLDPRGRTWTLASATDLVSAVQGAPATLGNAWPVKLTDGAGVNTPSVKAASTAVAATDPSLAVGLSPNSPLPAGANVIGSLAANQSTNVAQVGGSAVVTSVAGAPGVGGDTADGVADAGKSVKVGGKVVLNSAALPTALTVGQRAPAMVDEYGRLRIVPNRPKLLGSYKFESGRLTVLASAHASTAGFFWLINPVGSTALVYVKKLFATSVPTAVTAFASSPRVTVERFTFTGTASGATITPAKRDSNDAANTATLRTASTGLTITAGAVIADFTVPAVLTAVGIAVPVDQWFYDAADEDDYIVLRAGEGIVVRQADAGTTSDTRLVLVFGAWEER